MRPGQIVKTIPVSGDTVGSLSGVELDPVNNMLYAAVTTSFNGSSVSGRAPGLRPDHRQAGRHDHAARRSGLNFVTTIPTASAIAPDGTFWVAQPNSGNIIHVDASGNVLATFATGMTTPESAAVRADGQIVVSGFANYSTGDSVLLDPSTGNTTTFTSAVYEPQFTSTDPVTGGIWIGDFYNPFDPNMAVPVGSTPRQPAQHGRLLRTQQAQTDGTGNVWNSNFAYWDLVQVRSSTAISSPRPTSRGPGLTVWGVDNPNPPAQDTQDYYSFDLTRARTRRSWPRASTA